MRPIWTVDGITMPRNPDTFEFKWDKGTVTYEPQSDGSQIRVSASFLQRGGDVILGWKDADRKTRNYLARMMAVNPISPGSYRTLVMGNLQPALQAGVSWDTWSKDLMSQDTYDNRFGEGGTRRDLEITLRTDAYLRSANVIPGSLNPLAAGIAQSFGGHLGPGYDQMPVYNPVLFSGWFFPVTSTSQGYAFMNLGNAYWNPKIRINGPVNSGFTILSTAVDVDTTGQGVTFTYTGPNLGASDYLIIDTLKKRCFLNQQGVTTETYAFSLLLTSTGIPYPNWPGWPPTYDNSKITSQTSFLATLPGFTAGFTSIDMTNASTERFFYW